MMIFAQQYVISRVFTHIAAIVKKYNCLWSSANYL